MKTAEEWKAMWPGSSLFKGSIVIDSKGIKAIQLDAYRAGMLKAATECKMVESKSKTLFYQVGCNDCSCAILTAANELKELP